MHVLNIIRTVLLSVLCGFSLIVLGILANFTSITSSVGFYYHAFALGIAVSSMTLLFVGTSVVIDLVRRGAFTSLVWAELAWVGLLWVLWVAVAGSITSLGVFTTCDYYNSEVESNCRQYQAVQAFSWLNWLISLGWFITLLVLAIISTTKGNANIWFQSVTDVPFFGNDSGMSTTGATSEKFTVTPSPGPQQYPPQQPQLSYAPQQPQGYPVPQQQPVGYAPQPTYNNTGSTQPAYPQV